MKGIRRRVMRLYTAFFKSAVAWDNAALCDMAVSLYYDFLRGKGNLIAL